MPEGQSYGEIIRTNGIEIASGAAGFLAVAQAQREKGFQSAAARSPVAPGALREEALQQFFRNLKFQFWASDEAVAGRPVASAVALPPVVAFMLNWYWKNY
ncbi:hypothetical protein Z043_118256 [Scleropages formosus]|uniref:Uncharacterized protein n=1 Tax=Scleropages formosus TaxID=113540 RepID=A0A0P7TZV8_SCLFO|nr:hypothetical protein Z043_118256 [Scleropages formosus]